MSIKSTENPNLAQDFFFGQLEWQHPGRELAMKVPSFPSSLREKEL